MIGTHETVHHEHFSVRSYEEVVTALYEATGSMDEATVATIGDVESRAEFEAMCKAREGSSGFMRFMVINHGDWLSRLYDKPSKALLVILGNPLVAITMLSGSLQVGLNVPTRIFIYVDDDGITRVCYDLPSTLMTDIEGETEVAAAKLDLKLVELATQISGVDPSA
ncbi:DUF302 domain-containing protein [Paraburkholderia sp. SOS3]|uniref:DUF302 domain-containing protein n=1 Tax=Paraburkholderia sp. SOS3 TaxID=1926494 RepID=UPI0009475667|nr:DUF302 domain-containing protein [Paraburkholderia sp. SOS3]APR35701.1 hypothetical protein BTO02_10040 [Paraburkholderia sp. SOS3]